eukprot:TRINITY_DN68733_c0_g1_i1.p1 TRINITY_DN68733_c0_g1~~TRINITY_DN68733_c0_g1_i1.p1  ORF type:complete len:479 (+),score=21.77 TRINITY_DN68733_c0_g1_i1:25-1461(+)
MLMLVAAGRCASFYLSCILILCAVHADEFTANWMGHLLPVIGNQTLLDLSLPGTHDSMTYDLSDWIADGTNDIPAWLADILHDLPPHLVGPFIRSQGQTQWLNVTEQLNSGIRFIDFRIMYTLGEVIIGHKKWYCIHFVQSHKTALTYLKEIKQWVDAHPKEVITLWFSRHGSECKKGNDQYPGVDDKDKQKFWKEVEQLFSGLLLDNRVSSTNKTTLATLIQRNQRVIIYAADYVKFTASSPYALDSCGNFSGIDNQLHGGTGPGNFNSQLNGYANAEKIKQKDQHRNWLYLESTAEGAPKFEIKDAALIEYFPFIDKKKHIEHCAKGFNIPGLTNWCPKILLELSQLCEYYNQRTLEKAYQQVKAGNYSWGLPNAIYTDAVDVNGTVRTGLKIVTAEGEETSKNSHDLTRYAYVDTVLAVNVLLACQGHEGSAQCSSLIKLLDARRAVYPLTLWEQPERGRHVVWPETEAGGFFTP